MDDQKSAEAIVAPSTWRKGPNPEERQASRSLIGTDDGRRGVKPADTEARDGIPKASVCAEEPMAGAEAASLETTKLMERLVERENMLKAYGRVVGNKGAAGVDGMSVADLKGWLRIHWPEVKEALLTGRYQPMAVRGVEIPKPNGGKRQLGIPTVIDRLIQQALHQVLNPLFDPGFSPSSYGFRNGRSAHQAVLAAREFQRQGRRWVVDLDLAKFFDEVNHDLLMSRIAGKVEDKRLLSLIRRYLQAGIMVDGVTMERDKGTPQGGPLSPLLSNIMLDALDKELEGRGLPFCRYADDCNIYVRSRRAGERVMASTTAFIEKQLKLKVNREKSAVARPWKRKFLGYSYTSNRLARLRVAEASIERFQGKIRLLFRAGRGFNLGRFVKETLNPLIRGWTQYFSCAETKRFAEDLDGWIRRKLRCILWRQWKRPWTRRCRLMERGLPEQQAIQSAFNQRGAWWNSGAMHMKTAFPKKFFDQLGLVSMLDQLCPSR
jgi:RNA-directed DNA polymerase